MLTGIGKCWRCSLFCCAILASPLLAEPSSLQIKNPWIKLAPPGAGVNAGYMELYNSSAQALTISKMESSCCERLMLHGTLYEGDTVKMVHLDELVVKAGGRQQLQPGGVHIMLINPSPMLQLGDEVAINLQLANGQQQTVYFPVKASSNENNK